MIMIGGREWARGCGTAWGGVGCGGGGRAAAGGGGGGGGVNKKGMEREPGGWAGAWYGRMDGGWG